MKNPFSVFAKDKPREQAPSPEPQSGREVELEQQVIAALRTVYDPEIPLNIYDLGLIYDIDIHGHNDVTITMTLTTPHCPVAESMPGRVEAAVRSIDVVNEVHVNLVWDPPWSQDRISDEAKLTLGLL